MIAVDTNILVYAHRADSDRHGPARASVRRLAEGRAPWGLPWPCVHEFIAVATHPAIYDPPSTIAQALDQVEVWLASPAVRLLAETRAHWTVLKAQLLAGRVRGPAVHDARIAALCLAHGISELWTADRDFGRFPGLATRNPLVD